METKKHYKLFKSGKKWCAMAIVAAAMVFGANATVNADTTTADAQGNYTTAQTDVNTNTTAQSSATTDNSASAAPVATTTSQYAATTASVAKNGWVNENNQWTYYTNGQVENGRNYEYLPTINGQGSNWYLVDNGIAQSGVQKWAGTYYDFDTTNYQKITNSYAQSQWGDWYLFGNDGAIQTGVQKWAGTYYYFDPVTYLKVTNDYRQSQWGDWYLFGNDGKIQSGVQKWAGTYYYFDPSTYLRVDNDYRQSQWGDWYMFGNDGRIVSGLYNWQGSTYYFDPSTYLKVTNAEVTVNGQKYKLDANGIATAVNDGVDRALSMQGTPYVWGGNQPGGFDCSGLVQWAYKLGPNYRTTYQQQALGAHHYDVANAPKGSLLFFGSDSAPYHVAISLGNGAYVHAPEPGDVVKIGYNKYFSASYYVTL